MQCLTCSTVPDDVTLPICAACGGPLIDPDDVVTITLPADVLRVLTAMGERFVAVVDAPARPVAAAAFYAALDVVLAQLPDVGPLTLSAAAAADGIDRWERVG